MDAVDVTNMKWFMAIGVGSRAHEAAFAANGG